jgi:filamentous hemagglutinin
MNHHCYRIIFNRARGLFMAVAETAASQGKSRGETSSLRLRASKPCAAALDAGVRPLSLSIWLALGMVIWSGAAPAQVVADPHAPGKQRPTVLSSPNGVPLVNIQTPSAAGVSRNTYSQFDVQPQGVILNNSRTDTQTQLGGWVQANPWLAGGSARVILNEVNSNDPSLLRGYVEVAGQRAQVVIANPSGVTCDGCGFINANRATLTTGIPILNGGSLEGYRVQRGLITVTGAGLDASRTDYTELIARAVQVNAGIWATRLNVTAGANQVNVDSAGNQTALNPIAGTGAAPAFALDVARLGGMYAGKITLIGTEAGVGMRNAGNIGASAGEVIVTADGRIENPGTISAQGNAMVSTRGDLDNSGAITASGDTTRVQVGGLLTNRGLIDGHDTQVDAATITNIGTGRIYGDHLSLRAMALNNVSETVAGITSAGTLAARTRLDIGVQTLTNSEQALIYSDGDLAIGASLDGNRLATGRANSLTNASASIEAAGSVTLSAAQVSNLNNHLSTEIDPLGAPQFIQEVILAPGDVNHGGNINIVHSISDVTFFDCEATCVRVNATREESDAWNLLRYTRTQRQTVVTHSEPGRITAGGMINIDVDSLRNIDSQIVAGGALNLGGITPVNSATPGVLITHDSGKATYSHRVRERGHDHSETSDTPYNPADSVQSISLGIARLDANSLSAGSGVTVATASLFHPNPDPGAHYLIETDPRFADYHNWLSSDYLLQALALDPNTTQKRLGDGFYEQRLVREQVAELTGKRFIDGYASDEAEYQALMGNAVTFATDHKLRPGVALSADQVAQLTSDIVWLVEKTVTLPNGSTTRALVPQVYVSPQKGDLQPSGALLAGNSVNLNVSGDLTNSGTIAGRTVVSLTAQNVKNLGGNIQGNTVDVTARTDLDNTGGSLSAVNSLAATAGRDLNVVSTTSTQTSAEGARTNVNRVAGLYVTGNGGLLVASAGRDVNLLGAAIVNAPAATSAANPASDQPAGTTSITAGNNLNLGTVQASDSLNLKWDSKNYRNSANRNDTGTVIQAQGAIKLQAGNDLNAKAASVTSDQGALNVSAGRDINLTAGESNQQLDEAHESKSKSFGSTRTLTTHDNINDTTALSTTFSANTTALSASRDINVSGSNVVSTQGTTLNAGNDVNITSATQTDVETHFRQEKKSGLLSSGGVGFTVGTRTQSTDNQDSGNSAAASTIGSTQGNVTIQAGKHYAQTGSDVIAVQGNVDITAQKVDITEARETNRSETETKFKQTGVTVAVTSPVISAIQTAQQMTKAASDTKDDRMKVLAGATTGLAAWTAYDAVKTGQGSRIDGQENQIVTGNDENGKTLHRDANTADKVGGINVSISIGQSKSQSDTVQTSDHGSGSTVSAGGDIAIRATGAGKDSDLTVQGSNVQAGNNVTLQADNAINLLAGKNTDDQHSTNSSSSGSVGVSYGSSGLLFNVSASGGRGHADGTDVAFDNTHVEAGKQLTITSGGDTNLKGTVASANQVTTNVGGNLNIESLQDTSHYDSKQQSLGGSLSVGMGAMSGSVSASNSKSNSDFASVTEQSGIKTGDGGFNVNVKGNTDLKGGAITSTQAAVDAGANRFTTGTLSLSDIHNEANYDATSVGANIGAGTNPSGKLAPQGTSAGVGSDGGNASSMTLAAISGVAGNRTARTGDANSGIQKIFDVDKVQREINAQVIITQEFGQAAGKVVSDYSHTQRENLQKELKAASSESDRKAIQTQIDDINQQERVMNVLIGAITGFGAMAVTKESLSTAADQMRKITVADSKKFAGATDGETILSNATGISEGLRGDGFKSGGTRVVLDLLCGLSNKRCLTQPDGSLDFNEQGQVQFDPKAAGMSLAQFLETSKEGKEMAGLTGGVQV